MDLIETIAQELVAQNVNSAKEVLEELELNEEFDESNFADWGVNSENVMDMVKHNIEDIIKRARVIQEARFKADPEIAAAIKPAQKARRVLNIQK